jgi:predicted small lipoprotein YifL
MKTASKTAVLTFALMSAAGCGHKTKLVPPPQAQAPTGSPSQMTYNPAMPPLPPPSVRDATMASQEPASPPPTPPRRTQRHKPSPAKTAANDPASAAVEKPGGSTVQTASGNTPEGSPIGQLSSTGESIGSAGRHEVEQLVATTESGLNNIKRSLSPEEKVTSTQIRTFLTKAKQALADNDLDGAQTLATKAKVLLDELTRK